MKTGKEKYQLEKQTNSDRHRKKKEEKMKKIKRKKNIIWLHRGSLFFVMAMVPRQIKLN